MGAVKPMLTVLMATHNGARTLPTVLDAYCSLVAPPGGWKLVIIDNASTDTTKEVIAAFTQRLPLIYLFEPKRGKNAALNTGLGHTEGGLIVCTDDDAVPYPDWLVQLRLAADARPAFSIFGGRIVPRWETDPEPWILKWAALDTMFALTDPAWEEGPLTPKRVFGPNSAYRADIFKSGQTFDAAIGPAGSNYAMGSEYELNVRLMRAGLTAWHCKQAVVEHMIRKEQMNREWLLGRSFRQGRGLYRVEVREELEHMAKVPKLIFGVPRYMIRDIATKAFKVAGAKLNGDAKRTFVRRSELNSLIGQAYEARIMNRERNKPKSASGGATVRSLG